MSRLGSSPRVRGTRNDEIIALAKQRFIPACAGNAIFISCTMHRTPVHPRVCGERGIEGVIRLLCDGSSPRVRGTPSKPRSMLVGKRFIPACAGNARQGGICGTGSTVHPRVCGERTAAKRIKHRVAGSSPSVRGTRCACSDRPSPYWFIPACAGNAAGVPIEIAVKTVHPRVCGERWRLSPSTRYAGGSSPRVRGTHVQPGFVARDQRFIPACAGNACKGPGKTGTLAVHPRVCGERLLAARQQIGATGSSPRVRGTPCSRVLTVTR